MTIPTPPAIRFEKYVDRSGDCHEWTGALNNRGYGHFTMSPQRTTLAHRAAWELRFGAIADELCVCHSCDNPKCVNVDHLWLGTRADNHQDMLEKGRRRVAHGENTGHAKLRDTDIPVIRASDTSYRKLAAEYGVTSGAIAHIKKRRSWKHIP